MCGAGLETGRGEQRKALLSQRDEKIVALMKQQRPIAAIANLVGVEPDYCRKATRRLAEEFGLDYNPGKELPTDELLTSDTYLLRSNLARVVYDQYEAPGQHPLKLAMDTGITQMQLVQAKDRPFSHDYKLSQLERLARTAGRDFTRMMLIALLHDPNDQGSQDRLRRVLACLTN